ncbi:MAG TPA: helix-turn-helix transcriptional regulator [Pyrinomonadaceae bacterium]
MGTKGRPRPTNLSRKLRQIRIALKLSQADLVQRLGFEDSIHVGRISEYELNQREPSLLILLAYARLARVHLEDIVEDGIPLPARLPGKVPYGRSGHYDGCG